MLSTDNMNQILEDIENNEEDNIILANGFSMKKSDYEYAKNIYENSPEMQSDIDEDNGIMLVMSQLQIEKGQYTIC